MKSAQKTDDNPLPSRSSRLLGGIGEAFADRNFRIHTIGALISWLSFFIQIVGVSWTTWELTHSTTWLAIISLLDIAPNLVFLPLGGALADRFDRLRIVVITHVLALLQALVLAVLACGDHLTIGILAVLVFLHGLIHSFSIPALFGMLPRFIARPRLAAAIAVNAAYTQFAVFAGPAVAGWLIQHHGVAMAFASNVVGYAIYLTTLLSLRTPADYQPQARSGRSVWGDLLDGARYIIGHRGIATLLLVILVSDFLTRPLSQMLPAYAEQMLGRGIDGMSMLLAGIGFGATLAALWLAHGGAKGASPQRIIWAFLVEFLAIGALMLTHHLAFAVMAIVIYGMAGEVCATGTMSLAQLAVSDAQRGRVMSMQFLLRRIAGGGGTYVVGAIADKTGLQMPMLAAVGIGLSCWLYLFYRRKTIGATFQQKEQPVTAGALGKTVLPSLNHLDRL
jgi:MFS family permease